MSGGMPFATFKMASAVNMCCSRVIPNYSLTRIVAITGLFPGAAKVITRSASSTCLRNTRRSFLAQMSYGGGGMSPAHSGLWSTLPTITGNLNNRCGSCRLGVGIVMSYSTQKSSIAEVVMNAKLPPPPPTTPPSESPSGKEEQKDQQKKDSWFSGKNAWKFGLASLAVMGAMMSGNILVLWGRPIVDPEGNEVVDEFTELPTWKAYPKRAWKEMVVFKKMIQEPSSLKLLPEPLKEPWFQPPYTLVLEMTGVLVHPDWTLSTGWRFKKRPGLDYFLQQIGPPMFEVVIYTHEQGFTAFPIIDGLDPEGRIMFRLFRDATRYVNGAHVKDLGCLNRDLSKVIIVDCDPKSFSLQPQNAFLLKKWNGDDSDRTLVDLAAFLKTIALSNVEDVRTVLEHYSQFDDPVAAFKEKQRLLQEQQEEHARLATGQKTQKPLSGSWTFGLTGLRRS